MMHHTKVLVVLALQLFENSNIISKAKLIKTRLLLRYALRSAKFLKKKF
jgi:hypothetical protein